MGKWVVASAWPYVNNVPHLGNLVGSILSADVFARFLRLLGEDVLFVSGSDEHGTPIEIEAIRRGVHPKQLTDQAHEYVSRLFREWRISFDNYTRTESETHKRFVQEFWLKIYENGYIFTQEEVLPYCPRDKMFLPDRFVVGTCPYCGYYPAYGDQCENCGRLLHPTLLKDPRCAICGAKPEFRKSKHWFFNLPKLQDRVREWLEKSNLPDNVKNYSLSWIREGLKPRSVTRDNKWGIPAPFPGAEGKTIYVWFDALLGYISAVKEYFEKRGEPEKWREWWLNPETKTVYFIGKDNIPFHAIIFPAMLMATGDPYPLPYYISATEYLMYEGRQFSKSKRWGIWIDEALEIMPVDYWRFVLIRLRPETKDTNFKWSDVVVMINRELNDDLGNYVNRVLRFIESRFDSTIPEPGDYTEEDRRFLEEIEKAPRRVEEEMMRFRLKLALEKVLEFARIGNQYLNRRAPWDALKRGDRRDAATVIYLAANSVATLAILMAPFMPDSAQRLWEMLGLEGSVHEKGRWRDAGRLLLKPGHRIGRVEPLFRKLPPDFPEKIPRLLEEARRKVQERRPPLLRMK